MFFGIICYGYGGMFFCEIIRVVFELIGVLLFGNGVIEVVDVRSIYKLIVDNLVKFGDKSFVIGLDY